MLDMETSFYSLGKQNNSLFYHQRFRFSIAQTAHESHASLQSLGLFQVKLKCKFIW